MSLPPVPGPWLRDIDQAERQAVTESMMSFSKEIALLETQYEEIKSKDALKDNGGCGEKQLGRDWQYYWRYKQIIRQLVHKRTRKRDS